MSWPSQRYAKSMRKASCTSSVVGILFLPNIAEKRSQSIKRSAGSLSNVSNSLSLSMRWLPALTAVLPSQNICKRSGSNQPTTRVHRCLAGKSALIKRS